MDKIRRKKEFILEEKIELKSCRLCPRACGADRTVDLGFCGGGGQARIARAALHPWEEPCLSGTNGSGTVFFSGCPLRCCFCQNYRISAENFGKEVSVGRLAEIFLELQKKGAHNLNLVSPLHYAPWVRQALLLAKPELKIPVVCNTGGYETLETLRLLDGLIDIYLPDLKYADTERARRYSKAPDYFSVATQAILEMFRQTGPVRFGADGLLKRGLIVRHLVLPKGRMDSMRVLEWIKKHLPEEQVLVSLMSQYTPFYKSAQFPELGRRVSTFEYNSVLDYAEELGLKGFMQERSSAKEEYTPPFDLEGV
ncbi:MULTISPECIES: radical SAM protein [Anaerotruncus]|jgi:putative pyruvate formate lyase activating enzyme|uniref:radical SAM protein n=1 Tax=Anaerotruncus TaxID=244127 RepID=UPI0008301885|nr:MULTISPECIES: radical SAM protein [Anaerotruncus]RGX54596.1 radical SAM protein [Anaerotruncus sp. AF02-27]